jgi:hypothetical protein
VYPLIRTAKIGSFGMLHIPIYSPNIDVITMPKCQVCGLVNEKVMRCSIENELHCIQCHLEAEAKFQTDAFKRLKKHTNGEEELSTLPECLLR